ncbi:hypothetical protein VTH82DRAFT_7111 [Thermothelomyces myriococcoides]
MPYTPPSQRSPASSGPSSPEGSRRPSFHQPNSSGSRSPLPRSASYLTRHRRTPSATPGAGQPSPEATSEDLKSMMSSSSVRQSPPPITGVSGMPTGAIMSPPDSASDDDDLPQVRSRRVDNLKELHEAVSQIPHQRARLASGGGSPERENADAGGLLPLPSDSTALSEGVHHSFSSSSLDELKMNDNRRISHTRSATEPHVSISRSTVSSTTVSDEESDEWAHRKPQMVRKKSGELVRPALRPPSRRRPSSMPGTPTFSKAVHFDSHLEHVRHFLQVDRPLAVSAGSSPVDNYDSDTEYPFSSDERPTSRSPPFEWELILTNFPVETPVRRAQMVRLEKVWLSSDQKSLIGSVAVANIAFQKFVACRFTLDYWKTTSEVSAEYVGEVRPVETPYSQDRFHFSIKLSDLANLETKTLYFCIRYVVNGQEHWDNNNSTNFQIDFRKKFLPQNGKKAGNNGSPQSFHGLPKSNRRSGQKPKPSSTTSDEFGDSQKLNFDKSIHDYLGETGSTGLRLKSVKSSGDLPSDNISKGLLGPSGQFASRYDFGDSLSKAIQSAKSEMAGRSDGLYMKSRKKTGSPPSAESVVDKEKTQAPASTAPSSTAAGGTTASPADSPSLHIASASYEEIVSKWCFYGSKPRGQSSKPRVSPFEGADDSSSGTSSYDTSPLGSYYPQYQMPHQRGEIEYFSQVPALSGVGHAPAESPLGQLASPPSGESAGSVAQQQPAVTAFSHLAGTSPNEYQDFDLISEYHKTHGDPRTEIAHDVGSGPGNTITRLLPYFKRVVGSDINQTALDTAARVVPRELLERLAFVHSAAEALADSGVVGPDVGGEGNTDLILGGEVIPLLDVPRAIAAFGKLLRPGGTLAMYFYGRPAFTSGADPARLDTLYDRVASAISSAFRSPGDDVPISQTYLAACQSLLSRLDDVALPPSEWEHVVRYQWNPDIPLFFSDFDVRIANIDPVDRRSDGEVTHEIKDRTWWQQEWDYDRIRAFLSTVYPGFADRAGSKLAEIEQGFEEIKEALGGSRVSVSFGVVLILATKK